MTSETYPLPDYESEADALSDLRILADLALMAATSTPTMQGASRVTAALQGVGGIVGAQYFLLGRGDPLTWGDLLPTMVSGAALLMIGEGLLQHCGPVAVDFVDGCPVFSPPSDNTFHQFIAANLVDHQNARIAVLAQIAESASPARVARLLGAALPALLTHAARVMIRAQVWQVLQRMGSLARLSQMDPTTTGLEAAVTELAGAVARSHHYPFVAIHCWDAQADRLSAIGVAGTAGRASDTPVAWPALHERLVAQKSISPALDLRALDVAAIPDLPKELREFLVSRALSCLNVFPLVGPEDESLGTLWLARPSTNELDAWEVEILRSTAYQVAQALHAFQLTLQVVKSRAEIADYAERLQEGAQAQYHLARTDALTGIPNRRYLDEMLEAEVARASRKGHALSLILFDLDGFKSVNDQFGHLAGDSALFGVSDIARRTCRSMDIVGRFGGDEFLFILPHTRISQAATLAERFRRKLERAKVDTGEGNRIEVRSSIGVAELLRGEAVAQLLERADRALYNAKALGKNRVSVDSGALREVS